MRTYDHMKYVKMNPGVVMPGHLWPNDIKYSVRKGTYGRKADWFLRSFRLLSSLEKSKQLMDMDE